MVCRLSLAIYQQVNQSYSVLRQSAVLPNSAKKNQSHHTTHASKQYQTYSLLRCYLARRNRLPWPRGAARGPLWVVLQQIGRQELNGIGWTLLDQLRHACFVYIIWKKDIYIDRSNNTKVDVYRREQTQKSIAITKKQCCYQARFRPQWTEFRADKPKDYNRKKKMMHTRDSQKQHADVPSRRIGTTVWSR